MDPTEPIDITQPATPAADAETMPGRPTPLEVTLTPEQAAPIAERYELLEVIGQGGMGTVHRARQRSPDREVALKLIRAGATSRKLLKRFHLEAELLGRLQHPGIAQIYEADTIETPSGPQPYFAMELVRGEPLDAYAQWHELSTRQRLELFIKIADAVQHAHEKGIIHRDLKPGNILVTEDGQPKVLDFGVARATDADIQVTTIQTDVGQLIGTVPYMSPEQITGDPTQIDTRSDVYALGVVLYELLAGKLPYDLQQRMIHEAARVIREDDPMPLSMVNKTLRGDIETIVAKSLEKEQIRRYQTAAELAADVRRHLNDEPIVARAPSTIYQIKKFARRHTALVGGLVAVLLALTAGTIVASVLAVRATRAEHVAATRLAEAEATVNFLNEMLAAADPYQLGKDVTVREVLAESAKSIDRDFEDRPLVAARLHMTIGNTLRTLGDVEEAAEHIGTAQALRTATLGPDHPDTIRSEIDLAFAAGLTDGAVETEATLKEAVERLTRVAGPEHPETIHAFNTLAGLHSMRMDGVKAEPFAREATELSERAFGPNDPRTLQSQINLAMLLSDNGKFDEAEPLYLDLINRASATYGEMHPLTQAGVTNLGQMYYSADQNDKAIEYGTRGLAITLEIHGEDHIETSTVQNNLALAYKRAGEMDKAEPLYRAALAHTMRDLGERHRNTLIDMSNFAVFLAETGKHEEGLELIQRSVQLHREVMGSEYPGTGFTLWYLARTYLEMGRDEDALAPYIEAFEITSTTLGTNPPIVQRIGQGVANLYVSLGQPERATAWRATHNLPTPEPEAPVKSGG